MTIAEILYITRLRIEDLHMKGLGIVKNLGLLSVELRHDKVYQTVIW